MAPILPVLIWLQFAMVLTCSHNISENDPSGLRAKYVTALVLNLLRLCVLLVDLPSDPKLPNQANPFGECLPRVESSSHVCLQHSFMASLSSPGTPRELRHPPPADK